MNINLKKKTFLFILIKKKFCQKEKILKNSKINIVFL